jgi:L-asparagine oxygenase
MLRLDLPPAVTAGLRSAFTGLPQWSTDIDLFLARLLPATASTLPIEAIREVLAFRAGTTASPALLVTGLPVDPDLPPTPVGEGAVAGKPGQVSECAILSIAVLLGEPVGYLAEKGGVLVQDVFPTRAHRDTPSNESSAASLGFHTELTFSRSAPERPLHLASPDFVLLLGLRCPSDRLATTTVVDARAVCARLAKPHLTALREPQFQLRAPYSFTRDGDGSRPWSAPVAVLRGPAEAPSLAFDTACGVRALSPEADRAVGALVEACDDPVLRESVQLRAGDLLVIDNNRCAHSRSSFPASFDGRDRWLQRAYVRRSIWPLPVAAAGSRVLV